MFKHLASLASLAALALGGLAHAQTAAPVSPSASAPAPASASKKAVIAKLLQLLQPAVGGLAQQLAQQPAVQIQQEVNAAMPRVAAERREALATDINADLRQYVEDAVPIVRERALSLVPEMLGAVLDERFTEDELSQVIAIIESPANRKFQQLFPDMQRALGERLVAETRAQIEPKVVALNQSVSRRLSQNLPPANAAAAPRPSASAAAAKAPAKK
jgi:hypothetical protein